MSKKLILIAFYAVVSLGSYSQRPGMELTFTAVDSADYVQLDSIKVLNRTQGGDTVLYWPDSVLLFYYVGIPENSKGCNDFRVCRNYPNPVTNQSTISLFVPEKDNVSVIVTDMLGREALTYASILDKGIHNFRFTPGRSKLYFFIAIWRGYSSSIKIVQAVGSVGEMSSLEYIGSESAIPKLKVTEASRDFFFSPGDELLFIGYRNGLQSGLLDTPAESRTYTFQFATNIPCPGTPTVEYEGQVYNTIQIFSQCWLRENLNVGTMISGELNQSDNGIIEKYCYDNEPDSCTKYGGLYQWWEMMQYIAQKGAQGICPDGWHLPSDEEWKVLEGAVDSQHGIGDEIWDEYDWRGYDAGKILKATSGWYLNGNGTDLYGFSGLPGGMCSYGGYFNAVGNYGTWWTTTEDGDFPWIRKIMGFSTEVNRFSGYYKGFGLSLRCLKDD